MARRVTTLADFQRALRWLDMPPRIPIVAHASLSAFGEVQGGADTLVAALRQAFPTLLMPAFTYLTMLVPEAGPPHNAIVYGSQAEHNGYARFFRPDLPVDRLIGRVPERLRREPDAWRSMHPILSFVGVGADAYLTAQSLAEPLAPLRRLLENDGWVVLLGVDHTVNTSIHLAEKLAGRKTFIRWALTPRGVLQCPGFPGCSDGFNALAPHLAGVTRRAVVGEGMIQAIPLRDLIDAALTRLRLDPLALLCDRSYCERCRCIEDIMKGDNK